MALSALLFATMNLFARLATTSAPWTMTACTRATMGALVAGGVARARGTSLAPKETRAIVWRSVFGTAAMLSTFYALSSRTLSLGDTVTLFNLAPVFLALLAPIFLRERTSRTLTVALVLALTGVVLVLQPSVLFGNHGAASISLLLHGPSARMSGGAAVFAAFMSSIAMVMLRRAGRTESAETIAFHFSVFAAFVSGMLSVFTFRWPSPSDVGFMIAAGLLGGLGQLAMTRAYAIEEAARVGAMGYLSVVASSVLGAIVLGDRPSRLQVLGMALVVAAGLFVTIDASRGGKRPFPAIGSAVIELPFRNGKRSTRRASYSAWRSLSSFSSTTSVNAGIATRSRRASSSTRRRWNGSRSAGGSTRTPSILRLNGSMNIP
jgi:drug/metabolite transporter (DMT)-like permease